MSFLDLLRADGSIVVNKRLAKEIGLNEAIMLSEIISMHCYYEERNELCEDGWFYCTVEKMEENTTFTRNQQPKLIDSLVKKELIQSKKMGMPSKRYIRVDEDQLALWWLSLKKKTKQKTPSNPVIPTVDGKSVNKSAENQSTSELESSQQVGGKAATINTNNNNTNNNTKNNTKSVSQSEDMSEPIRLAIEKDSKMTDRQTEIVQVYLSVKNDKNYSDALFIATMQKAVKAMIKVPFGQYLLKAMIKNMSELNQPVKPKSMDASSLPEYIVSQMNQARNESAAAKEQLSEDDKKVAEDLLRQLGEIE